MASRSKNTFHMGRQTLKIDRLALHGAIRSKVAKMLREASPSQKQGLILLKAGSPFHIHDTDTEGVFRQESYFHYLFGVTEEDYYGAVNTACDPPKAILFMPRLPDSYAVWMGHIDGPEEKQAQYAVDEVHYTEDMADVISKINPPVIHVLAGTNSDSDRPSTPATFEGIERYTVDKEHLYPVLQHARAVKTSEEIAIMRFANEIASSAHVEVMQACKPGMMEYQLEAIFLGSAYKNGGCRHAPYTPICASGPNGSTLHYGHAGAPNDCEVKDGAMMLMDMGSEYYSYDSDITCSYPANGHFTPDQKVVYEAVLSAQQAVLGAIKPGVHWPDMHRLAERCILTGLQKGGFIKADADIEAAVQERIGALFMPHGLGHLLGIDTHDAGGYAPGTPPRINEPGLRSLRTARVLEENMIVTVEPGCYFNPFLLEPAFQNPAQAKYLGEKRLRECMDFGGVRIEDDVIVTSAGSETMTNVPRSLEDVEMVMAGASWPRK
ncbi:hypothetical protein WJX73_000520 [Symbiochloris irregularis]|uniref:Xaa-Pro dipeptidase n=1 Tax=Symbiochloris irregularis TaxID=706552 RepID=A0AAW1NY69_9CHLO